jgi:CP family cyanate transporter-like MFS transporter
MPTTTSWPRAGTFFLAGVASAFLVGKVSAVLPLLRAELGLSLFQAGLVVSIFNLIAGFSGIMFGALADRVGHARIGIAGLVVAAAGSLLGATAETPGLLLASRVVEGAGFFMATVSMPPLLMRVASIADRQKIFGLWGAYMPTGTGLMMLTSGLAVAYLGWRGIWIMTACLILAAAVLVVFASRATGHSRGGATSISLADVKRVSRHRGPLLLALIFGAYAGQFLAVTAFIPLILVEHAGWSLAAAGTAGAGIIAINILGNLASGPVLDAGYSRKAVIIFATIAMALGAGLVMADSLPVAFRISGGLLFSAIGGLIPGTLFSGTAVHAPSPGLMSTVNGLMMQGSSIGQALLPTLVSLVVGMSGLWASAVLVTLPAAAIVIFAAFELGRLEASKQSAEAQ